jgi:hypothetical protein
MEIFLLVAAKRGAKNALPLSLLPPFITAERGEKEGG